MLFVCFFSQILKAVFSLLLRSLFLVCYVKSYVGEHLVYYSSQCSWYGLLSQVLMNHLVCHSDKWIWCGLLSQLLMGCLVYY